MEHIETDMPRNGIFDLLEEKDILGKEFTFFLIPADLNSIRRRILNYGGIIAFHIQDLHDFISFASGRSPAARQGERLGVRGKGRGRKVEYEGVSSGHDLHM